MTGNMKPHSKELTHLVPQLASKVVKTLCRLGWHRGCIGEVGAIAGSARCGVANASVVVLDGEDGGHLFRSRSRNAAKTGDASLTTRSAEGNDRAAPVYLLCC